MDYHKFIDHMEVEWDEGGFFEKIRNGNYDSSRANYIIDLICSLETNGQDFLPKRLISLIWYIPIFLDWQVDRVTEQGGDTIAFDKFRTNILNKLQDALGVP
jgi:hypothetical protein